MQFVLQEKKPARNQRIIIITHLLFILKVNPEISTYHKMTK